MKKTIITEDLNNKYCSVCKRAFVVGEYAIECEFCNSFTHEICYKEHGCGSESCSHMLNRPDRTEIVLTKEEVSSVIAVPDGHKNPSEFLIHELNKKVVPYSSFAIVCLIFAVIVIIASCIAFILAKGSFKYFYLIAFIGGVVSCFMSSFALASIKKGVTKGFGIGITAIALPFLLLTGTFVHVCLVSVNQQNEFGDGESVDAKKMQTMIENSEDKIKNALKANVLINSGFGLSKSMGSGVVIKNVNNKTYIITNVHVLTGGSMVESLDEANKKARNVSVTFYNGDKSNADILWVAPHKIDLALIQVNTPKDYNTSVKIGNAKDLKMGQNVFAIGNPMGLDWTYTDGSISSFRTKSMEGHEITIIQIQTPLNHGNSGGGLYNKESELVGINTYIYEKSSSEGLNFSISIDEFVNTLDDNLKEVVFSE